MKRRKSTKGKKAKPKAKSRKKGFKPANPDTWYIAAVAAGIFVLLTGLYFISSPKSGHVHDRGVASSRVR